jgi:hypothetical protein
MPRVASSAISRIEYNAFARELLVVFTTGRTYTYFDVSREVYDQFGRAPSKGAFFNLMIRDSFEFVEHRR